KVPEDGADMRAEARTPAGVPASAGMSSQRIVPLTGLIDPELLLHGEGNTIMYEQNPKLRELLFGLFSTGASPASSAISLRQLLCCLPQVAVPYAITYDNVFRVIIMQF